MRALLLFALALVVLGPAAMAGISLPTTPAGAHCILQDTDTCVGDAPFTSLGPYGMGFNGLFLGTLGLTLDGGGYHHELICRNLNVAGLWLDTENVFGTCDHIGMFPPAGIPMALSCRSEGTGIALCSMSGP
jgi:hypothetical protein